MDVAYPVGPGAPATPVALPQVARIFTIDPLPGQPQGVSYGVVTGLDPRPSAGQGYVAELLPDRQARILAWVADDGKVYACDGLLSDLGGLRPALVLTPNSARGKEGVIHVANDIGGPGTTAVGEYRRSWSDMFSFAHASRDLGRYTKKGKMEAGMFLAVAWLAFAHIPRIAGVPRSDSGAVAFRGERIFTLLRPLVEQPLPDALDSLIWRGTTNEQPVSAFERFAARQLIEAGAGQIRAIAAEHDLDVVHLTTTELFYIRFNAAEIGAENRAVVLAVEAAINRLARIDDAARERDGGKGLLSTCDEQFCAKVAEDTMRSSAAYARLIAKAQDAENPYRTIHGVEAARGSAWDVCTRFTGICEKTSFPFRMEYRFDTNVKAGVMAVRFALPSISSLPASRLGESGWYDARELRPAMAASYAFRLAGTLAYAAFASSMRVTSVDVTGVLGAIDGTPVLSLGFDRTPFLMGASAALRDGRCDNPVFDTDPLAILNLLHPARHSVVFGPDRGLAPIEPLPISPALAENRTPLWQDHRPLPDTLRGLLRADTAAELDVLHDDAAASTEDVQAIVNDNEDSPLIAGVQLEALLAQLGEDGPDEAGRLPLYCTGPSMRLMVGEINDADGESRRYWKYPDAAFDAHVWLSRFARESGDWDRAIAEAETCVRLAPTSARGYIELAVSHAEHDQYAQAAMVLLRGLKMAVLPADCDYMYYRLAYALWQTGQLDQALACYGMISRERNPRLAATIDEEERGLLSDIAERDAERGDGKSSKDTPYARMNPSDAATVLKASGIPVAPVDGVTEALAKAAIALLNAGFPLAAYDAVWMLGLRTGGDVIAALPVCLRNGVSGD